jgi:hypothetical protein
MDISTFDDLLRAARAQPEPQRLLFVFANAVLPDGSTEAQRARFAAGEGGALVPLMFVDKTPEELETFGTLLAESRQFGAGWSVVFAASLAGRDGRAPAARQTEEALQRMVESIKTGAFGALMPFDRQGQPVLFE